MSQKDIILQALRNISNISNTPHVRFDQKLDQILEIVLNCLNAKKGSIMILKGPGNLRVEAASNQALKGVIQPLGENSASAWVVKHKKPLFNDSVEHMQELYLAPDRYHKNAFMIAPLICNDNVYGVISITEKIGTDQFSQEERETFFDLAGHMISTLEIYRLAESLKNSRQVLRKKNDRLQELERLRTDMFNMLIHDLKGPLSVIVANLDILSYTSNMENMAYVNTARSGCDAMYGMISNLLDITRLEDGTLRLIWENLEPAELIEEAMAGIKTSAEMRNVFLLQKIPLKNSSRTCFQGDRSLLLRVLQNLLINAIRFSPNGKTVETGFRVMENQTISFFVKDDGPGVPLPLQQNIFDKYVQISDSQYNRNDYTIGLGLTFCKMAVEAHLGTIWVESDGKTGSCFHFRLPFKKEIS